MHRAFGHRSPGWMAAGANPKHAWLYVSGFDSGNVLIYDLDRFGIPQIGEITDGIQGPRDITLDGAGNLYVANTNGNTVTIYAPGATSPSLTLSQTLSGPVCATADAQGNVWVSNHGGPASISVFPPGQTAPSQTITGDVIASPEQIAFDAAGDAIFGDDTMGVSEIPAGSTNPVSLHLKGLVSRATEGIALDGRRDLTYVSFGFLTNHVNVYHGTHKSPIRALSAPTADGLAIGTFRGREVLFVPGSQTSTVSLFYAGAKASFATMAVGTSYTRGAAFKPAGVP